MDQFWDKDNPISFPEKIGRKFHLQFAGKKYILLLLIAFFFLLLLSTGFLFLNSQNISNEIPDNQSDTQKDTGSGFKQIKTPDSGDTLADFKLINIIKKDSYVESMAIDDLDGDGKNELVYKEKDLHLLNNDFSERGRCPVGDSGNGIEKTITVDMFENGRKQIFTVGIVGGHEGREQGNEYSLKIIDENCEMLNEYQLSPHGLDSTSALYFEDIDKDGIKDIVAQTEFKYSVIKNGEYSEYDNDPEQKIGFIDNLKLIDLYDDSRKQFLIIGSNGAIIKDQTDKILWRYVNYNITTHIDVEVGKLLPGHLPQIIVSSSPPEGPSTLSILDNTGKEIAKNSQIEGEDLSNLKLVKLKKNGPYYLLAGNLVLDDSLKVILNLGKVIVKEIEDLNNDGNMEIIAMQGLYRTTAVGPVDVVIFDNQGKSIKVLETPTWISSLIIGDITGNATKEIVVASHYDDPIHIFGTGISQVSPLPTRIKPTATPVDTADHGIYSDCFPKEVISSGIHLPIPLTKVSEKCPIYLPENTNKDNIWDISVSEDQINIFQGGERGVFSAGYTLNKFKPKFDFNEYVSNSDTGATQISKDIILKETREIYLNNDPIQANIVANSYCTAKDEATCQEIEKFLLIKLPSNYWLEVTGNFVKDFLANPDAPPLKLVQYIP